MSRYNKIRKMDISNGPGIRVSIFLQGCEFHCEGCFNGDTHDFNGGQEFTDKELNEILDLAKYDYIVGLSILGGEPLHPKNVETTKLIAKAFKEKYPNKTVWIWTGYKFENLNDNQISVLEYTDVLVDGQFEIAKKDLHLKYAGSSNQRAIDIKKTVENKALTFYE